MRPVLRGAGGDGAVAGARGNGLDKPDQGDRHRGSRTRSTGKADGLSMDLARIQEEIRNQKLDGWLFFDHHLRDPLAYRVLGIHVTKGPSRRWYYMIPAEGEPVGMEHRIERSQLDAVP